jgi:hypothetical protein
MQRASVHPDAPYRGRALRITPGWVAIAWAAATQAVLRRQNPQLAAEVA